MKKILEYRVFDLLKDKENEKFLDKVKKENPDLYAKFLNILGNKGLEIAKQKYQEFDPKYIEREKEREKEIKLKIKRENTKEAKKQKYEKFLKDHKDEIEEIKDILDSSALRVLARKIENNSDIKKYFKSIGVDKKYKKDFLTDIRTRTRYMFNGYTVKVDTLSFLTYGYWGEDREEMLKITQYYNTNKKELKYSIFFNMVDEYENKTIDTNFIITRNKYIENLSKSNISISELYIIIEKFSLSFSDKVYDDWKLDRDAKKYNL